MIGLESTTGRSWICKRMGTECNKIQKKIQVPDPSFILDSTIAKKLYNDVARKLLLSESIGLRRKKARRFVFFP